MAEFIYQMIKARKTVGDKVILNDVTMSFFPGAKIGMVGPNGAGKSTILKIMAGLDQPSNGEARLTAGYTVGILLQEPPLNEEKTVLGNVEEGVGEIKSKLDRFNEISALMAEPDADFDALMEEMGQLQEAIDAANAWDLDSQLEQILCFDTEIDAERFCREKCAVFLIMPEEDPNTFFMISLIIQQLYREILAVADEMGGRLPNRCVFFCDEFGTLPKIESAEMMSPASRSRRLQIVPIIQSFAQLERNYGKEGADIIVDNTQLTIFGGFAPHSSSVDALSKALGSRTALSGSVSRGKKDPSQSLQMIERPLMTPDELKSMPKGQFVVMKTGCYPMKVRLKLFFHWGIQFGKPYTAPERGNRKVAYADKAELVEAILAKYLPPPAAKQQKRPGHGNPPWEEAAMGKKSSLPERRPLRTAPPGENQGRE